MRVSCLVCLGLKIKNKKSNAAFIFIEKNHISKCYSEWDSFSLMRGRDSFLLSENAI